MAISRLQRSQPRIIEKVFKNIDYFDYDYRGKIEGRDFKITQASPVLNAYKMWLQSSKSDYIRNYGFGGFFMRNLNEYEFSPDSEAMIKQDLINKTKEIFPEIDLLSVEVKCMTPDRYWKVKVAVKDTLIGYVALDMAVNGESIKFSAENS